MKRITSLVVAALPALFLILPLYASNPVIEGGASVMPITFKFEGNTYKVYDNEFDPNHQQTIRYDFDGDGQIMTLVGFRGVAIDDEWILMSFMVIGREAAGKFKPEIILSGRNDRFDKIELKDIDNDKRDEIIFWSTGGAHHTDLDIYKYSKSKIKKIFSNGSACSIELIGGRPTTIKIGVPQFDKPGWSYGSNAYLYEIWQWDDKKFTYNEKLSSAKNKK